MDNNNDRLTRRKFNKGVSFLVAGGIAGGGALKTAVGEESKVTVSPNREILLERVEKIYSDGRWNGRPEVELWKGRYYLGFVSAAEHESPDSKIVIMRSEGGEPRKWGDLKTIVETDDDDMEIHFLSTPNRLFAYVVKEHPTRMVVTYTEDGVNWSKPEPIYKPLWSFWKLETHKGVHYVAADIMKGKPRLELLKSTDGLNWGKVSTILDGNYTETALVFLPDDSLLAITRQPGPSISHAYPPYTEWKVYNKENYIGGIEAARVDDTILVSGRCGTRLVSEWTRAGRFYPDDQLLGDCNPIAPQDYRECTQRTALWTLDMDKMRLQWKMHMVTQLGGDQSYPHFLVLGDHRVLMVWYDGEALINPVPRGEPKRADIFLAVLRIM